MRGACLYTSGQEDLPSNMPGISRYYKILQVGMQRAGLESIRQRVMSYDAAVHCISWYSTHLVIIQYRALRIFLQTFVHMCTTMYYIHILSISMISIYIYGICLGFARNRNHDRQRISIIIIIIIIIIKPLMKIFKM